MTTDITDNALFSFQLTAKAENYGDTIHGIVIGNILRFGGSRPVSDRKILSVLNYTETAREFHAFTKPIPNHMKGRALKWGEAEPYLQYKYLGDDFVHAIYAWGNKGVYFIAEYDGSTWIQVVPRHVTHVLPESVG